MKKIPEGPTLEKKSKICKVDKIQNHLWPGNSKQKKKVCNMKLGSQRITY